MIKSLLILALTSSLSLPITLAQLGLHEYHEDLERQVNCNSEDCHSKPEGRVCGTNGKTYESKCDLERDICNKVNVTLKHRGECSFAGNCFAERASREERVKSYKEPVHVPTCLPDGTYAPVQCHNFSSICWCSTANGQLIVETLTMLTISNEKPLCLRNNTTALPPKDPPSHSRCQGKKRKTFFDNLEKLLMKEYKRNTAARKSALQEAIKWNFQHRDQNRDGVLKRKEYRGLRKIVKKFVNPKRCAKVFPELCDINQDKKLTQEEWTICFTLKSSGKKNSGGRRRGCLYEKKCDSRAKKPESKQLRPCVRERETLLQDTSHENNSIPVLECQPNGNYEPIQCYKDICFCVDEFTGNSLEGTTMINGTRPDCSKPSPHAREWPGCVGDNKKRFMQDLMEFLVSTVNDIEGPNGDVADLSSRGKTIEEFAALHHFRQLDKNNNSFIDRRERKEVKKLLKKNPKLKACGKKITKYCDVNSDQMVSKDEWMACVIFLISPIDKYLIAE